MMLPPLPTAAKLVRGALGPILYKGKNQRNPVNTVAVDQIRNGRFVKILKSVPKNVPAP